MCFPKTYRPAMAWEALEVWEVETHYHPPPAFSHQSYWNDGLAEWRVWLWVGMEELLKIHYCHHNNVTNAKSSV